MKKLLFLFFSVSTFSSVFAQSSVKDSTVDYAFPEKYSIAGIRVTGDDVVNKNLVGAVSGLFVGQELTIPGDEISKAITNLWKQQLFSNVRVLLDSTRDGKAWLNINVKSRPRLSKYTFTGVSKGQSKKLKEEVKLNAREVVTESVLANIDHQVREFYQKKGFADVKVSTEIIPDSNNTVGLKVHVDRGERIKVHSISFDGATAFTDKRLKRVLKKTKEYRWWKIWRSAKFKPDEYDEDKQKIAAFYHSKGYKDARLISDSFSTYSPGRINIKFKVFEGEKYYFRNITWAGNTKYDSRFLNSILNIKKGDVYNPDQLEKNLFINQNGLDVTSLYMDDGYLFFSVTPVETHVENDSVDLEIRIFEGPQATINKVTVTGNTKTHDHVILRELRTKPGMKFSRSDIIRSQRELSQLGYFDPEKMNVIPKPNPVDGTVDLEYVVVEKPSDQVELSGGWGAGRLVGVLGLSLNNFSARNLFKRGSWQGYPSGDGQRVSVRAQTNGPNFQSYNLSFTEPWFGGKKPNSFTFSAFYSVQQYLTTLANGSPGTASLKTPGISIGLGKRLKWPDDYFTAYYSLAYQHYNFKNYALPSFTGTFTNGYANNIYFRGILSRNSADQPIYPHSGSSINLSLQVTPPIASALGYFQHKSYKDVTDQERYKFLEYHKWKFDASYFIGLGAKKKFVIAPSMNFGFIGLFNREIGQTPFERFFVGGDGLGYSIDGREYIRFRGYADPKDVTPSIKSPSGVTIEPGGIIYNRYTFELRYPVTTMQAATIYGLAFIEGGNAFLKFSDYDPFNVKRSAGVGVRVFLPMFGLLGFDWGYGFDPSLQNPGQPSGSHFHFYIGQPLY